MKGEKINSELYNYCSLNKFEKARKLLEDNFDDIDLTYENGSFFDFAIVKKNVDMLNTLLQYYKQTKLQGDPETFDYKVAKQKLQIILQDAVDSFNISEEMQEVLNQYLPTEEGDNLEQELGETEDLSFHLLEDNDQGGNHYENSNQDVSLIGNYPPIDTH